ncbi:MAG: adenylate kinase [Candidatus Micrarchaeia archaeon]|jgi:adenylate kinase
MAMTIVLGVPGAGKSTVLAALKGKEGCTLVNYGDLMFDIASKKKYVSHRDDLRKLPPATQKKVQSEVGDFLAEMEGNVVLDTHCSIATPKGYLPGLPFFLLGKLNVSQLVLITAPIKDIIARRGADKTRARDAESEESLKQHHDMNLALLAAYAAFCGAPAKVIVNSQGNVEEARKALLSLFE